MSKRLRLLIVVLVLAAVGFMLWPTIQWYFFWDDAKRDQASFTTQAIKNEAQRFAEQGLLVFNDRFNSDPSAELDLSAAKEGNAVEGVSDSVRLEVFTALKEEVSRIYKKAKRKLPASLSYDLVKGAFVASDENTSLDILDSLAQSNMKMVLEGYKREALFKSKDKSERIIQLGLDLAGGVSYTLKADIDGYAEMQNKVAYEAALEEAVKKLKNEDSALTQEEAEAKAKEAGVAYDKYDINASSNIDRIMEIAVEQITERVDIYGASEPDIRRLGRNWIQVDLPGAKDPERLKRLLMGKGSLNFHVVDDEQTSKLLEWMGENYNNPELLKVLSEFQDGEALKVPAAAGIKNGYFVVGLYEKDIYREDRRSSWLVVNEEIGMPGSMVDAAYVSQGDDTGEIATSFRISREGQKAFGAMTKDAATKPVTIAVIMDGKAKMSAVASKQLNDSMLQVKGRGINRQEAQDFAQLLTLGSKEVGIEVLNSDIIGSGLGEDYIRKGLNGLAWALILVLGFMLVWYLGGGLAADIAMILNIFIMAGILSQIQMTLTMAGMAGLVLTVGMSVDANVIIYERIKEEARNGGKSAASALRTGFKKAFWTILDSNITTFIAAVVLSYFGSSTVKGFAMILAVGIFSSMFTSLVVARLFLDFGVETLKVKRLLISWRK